MATTTPTGPSPQQIGGGLPPSNLPGGLAWDPAIQRARAGMARSLATYEAEILEAKKRALIDYGDPELTARVLGEAAADNTWMDPVYGIDYTGAEGMLGKLAGLDVQLAGPKPMKTLFAQRLKGGIKDAQSRTFKSPFEADVFWRGLSDVGGKRFFKPKQIRSGGIQAMGSTVKSARDNPYSTLAMMKMNRGTDFRNLRESVNKSNLWYSSERGRREGLLGTEYGRKEQDAAVKINDYLKDLDKKLAAYKEGLGQQEMEAAKKAASAKFSNMAGR